MPMPWDWPILSRVTGRGMRTQEKKPINWVYVGKEFSVFDNQEFMPVNYNVTFYGINEYKLEWMAKVGGIEYEIFKITFMDGTVIYVMYEDPTDLAYLAISRNPDLLKRLVAEGKTKKPIPKIRMPEEEYD